MSDLPSHLPYVLCPKHGAFPLTADLISHVTTTTIEQGKNPMLQDNYRVRRMTPYAHCRSGDCRKIFTNRLMSRVYDIPIKFIYDSDSEED